MSPQCIQQKKNLKGSIYRNTKRAPSDGAARTGNSHSVLLQVSSQRTAHLAGWTTGPGAGFQTHPFQRPFPTGRHRVQGMVPSCFRAAVGKRHSLYFPSGPVPSMSSGFLARSPHRVAPTHALQVSQTVLPAGCTGLTPHESSLTIRFLPCVLFFNQRPQHLLSSCRGNAGFCPRQLGRKSRTRKGGFLVLLSWVSLLVSV